MPRHRRGCCGLSGHHARSASRAASLAASPLAYTISLLYAAFDLRMSWGLACPLRSCDTSRTKNQGGASTMYAKLIGLLLAAVGAFALGGIALHRNEPINSLWLVTASICIYILGYRFYAKWIETRVFIADYNRATPAERLNNGRDFLPTHRWVVFGHHFAAIA